MPAISFSSPCRRGSLSMMHGHGVLGSGPLGGGGGRVDDDDGGQQHAAHSEKFIEEDAVHGHPAQQDEEDAAAAATTCHKAEGSAGADASVQMCELSTDFTARATTNSEVQVSSAEDRPPQDEELREVFNCEGTSLVSGSDIWDTASCLEQGTTSSHIVAQGPDLLRTTPPRAAGKDVTTTRTEELVVGRKDVMENLAVSTPGQSEPFDLEGQDIDSNKREQLLQVTILLQQISKERDILDTLSIAELAAFRSAAGRLLRPEPGERACSPWFKKKCRDNKLLGRTGIRRLRDRPVFITPDARPIPRHFQAGELMDSAKVSVAPGKTTETRQRCYVCKNRYTAVHDFYDQLCRGCAVFNYAKRGELAELSGKVALLTGGRVKIGYQAGIKLLRCGVRLIVTTRFPRDAASRYAAEADFKEWEHRLDIFGLDLRHTPSIVAFCRHIIDRYDRLDFIVNNACQTIRRPPGFYGHITAGEALPFDSLGPEIRKLLGENESLHCRLMSRRTTHEEDRVSLPGVIGKSQELIGLTQSVAISQTPLLKQDVECSLAVFPEGRLDQDLQQVDLRDHNTWRMRLHEVSPTELLETQLVNAVAPFVFNANLKPLMEATPGRHKHIVNVSAMEGQFYRHNKTVHHPHTNMAKAALNMMTRTAAADYFASGIHMNSVDTGWVTDENPIGISQRGTFHPPLDIVDGAARVVDPIISGVNTEEHVWGQFLKDYKTTLW